MATRLFLPSSGTPAVSPAFDPSWTVTTGAARRPLGYRLGTSSVSADSASETSATEVRALLHQYVSDPLPAAVTIDAQTFTWATGSRAPGWDTANARLKVIVRIFTSTNTVRGTIFTGETAVQGYPFFSTHVVSGLTTAIACQPGDRMVIEVGFRFTNTSTSSASASLFKGDNFTVPQESGVAGTNSFSGNDYVPWFEFSSQDEIWGANIARASSLDAQVVEKPTRTPMRLGAVSAEVVEQPSRVPLRLAAISVQTLIPRAGQKAAGVYAAGFPDTEPLIKMPDGRWVPLRPASIWMKSNPLGSLISLAGSNHGYSGTGISVPDTVLPTDLIVFVTSSKMASPPRTITSGPTGVPGATWTVKYRSGDDRTVMWFGTGATGPGTASYTLSGGDANRSNSVFVLRNVKGELRSAQEQFNPTANPTVFTASGVKRDEVALLHTISGNGVTFSTPDVGWSTLAGNLAFSAAQSNPLADSENISATLQHSSGSAGLLMVVK